MRWFTMTVLALALAWSAGAPVWAASPSSPDREGHFDRKWACSVHRAMYMRLMAEKYAPETAGQWKQVMDERAELKRKLREAHQARSLPREDKSEEMKRFYKENRETLKNRREVFKAFTKAVRAEDEAQIRAALPRLLESERAVNDLLRKWAAMAEKEGKKEGKKGSKDAKKS